jgi:hypothetical protein
MQMQSFCFVCKGMKYFSNTVFLGHFFVYKRAVLEKTGRKRAEKRGEEEVLTKINRANTRFSIRALAL